MNQKMITRILKLAFALACVGLMLAGTDSEDLQIVFFSEDGCPQCRRVKRFLEGRVEDFYPVEIVELSINADDNARKLIQLAELYDAEEVVRKGAPALFVADRAFHGDRSSVFREMEEVIRSKIYTDTISPLARLEEVSGAEDTDFRQKITLPALLGAAAVDAVNPCACAVLTLMLGSILLVARKKRVRRILMAGFAFTLAVFICYVLMGIGLFSALEVTGLQDAIYLMAGILAIAVGVWNLKDALMPEKLPSIEVPKSWQPRISKISSAVTSVPGAFGAGCLISWMLLPCTSGPYVVVLGMLGNTATRFEAILLILLYNLVFIIPFIAITLILAFGIARPYQIESWRQNHKRWLHLATGIFMLGLGVILLFLSSP